MEFLLVSDIHVDAYAKFATTDPKTGMNSRLKWTLDIFDQIMEYGEEQNITTLLIGGDLFDKRGTIHVPVYDAVYSKLSELRARDWVVSAIVGNHDQALRSGDVHALRPMPMYVCDKTTMRVVETSEGILNIGMVSFHETPKEFLGALEEVAEQERQPGPIIYLIHQGIRGAKIAGDEILSREEVTASDIRRIVGEEPWIFSGHYHIHQKVDPRFYYIGSAVPKDFGDTTPKGFLHFKNGKIEQIESRAPKFVTVDLDDGSDFAEKVQGNYAQFIYSNTEDAKIVGEFETAGFITTPKKVDREYTRRSSINPEHTPVAIIQSYLKDLEKEGKLPDSKEELVDCLNTILEGRSIESAAGGKEISIEKIEIMNFMSYRESVVDVRNLEGLVLIEGENRDDPSAISNGSGKSVIPEAIKWALYGSTARGITGDDVVNRDMGKDCYVQIWLRINGRTFSVLRTRKHSELKNQLFFEESSEVEGESVDLRGKTDADTQARIIKELGLGETTFDNTVFFGHGFTKSFAALTDKEQKAVLETILGVEYFVELNENAKVLGRIENDKVSEMEIKMNYLGQRIEETRKSIETIRTDAKAYESSRVSRIAAIDNAIKDKKDFKNTISDCSEEKAEIEDLELKILELEPIVEEFEKEREEYEKMREAAQELRMEMEKAEYKKTGAEGKIEDEKRILVKIGSEMEKLRGGIDSKKCPLCEQAVKSVKNLQEKIEKLEVEERDAKKRLIALEDGLAELQKKIPELKSDREQQLIKIEECKVKIEAKSEVLDRMQDLFDSKSEAERKLASIQNSVDNTNREIERLKEEGSRIIAEVNPHKMHLEREIEKLETSKNNEKEARIERDRAKASFLRYKFWEYAFSDKGTAEQSPIKSYLFDAVVPTLDELAKIYADILTDGSIEVRFNTVTALKSGELRDKFSVEVINKYGAADYKGDSGGERRKVDLAIIFALHSLASIRSGSKVDVLFLDEILDSLDAEGCERVMILLREMTDEIRSIFVITHNEILKTQFSSRLQVIKKAGISSVIGA